MRFLSRRLTAFCGLALLAALLFALAVFWLLDSRARAAETNAPPTPVLQHDGAAIVVPLVLPAVVEADPARMVKVAPPTTGRVMSLDKDLGDPVKAGDLLFRLDSADLAQARSDAQKAASAQVLAAKALERQRQLGEADIAAQREVEQARDALDQAQSELTRADRRLAGLQAAAGGKSGRAGKDDGGAMLSVRSPVSGRVVDLAGAPGTFWNDATVPLMTVADLSKVFVTASAGEADLGKLFAGQPVQVRLGAYPGEIRSGSLRHVGDLLDPDTRRVKLRIAFDNADGRLKPGMFASATFLSPARSGLLVPIDAVVQSGLQTRVFVETAPWRFEPRVVQLGPRIGDRIEIASGIKSGERIVVHDGVLLDD
jgi:membrane fusion protein, heavy metal efflux system